MHLHRLDRNIIWPGDGRMSSEVMDLYLHELCVCYFLMLYYTLCTVLHAVRTAIESLALSKYHSSQHFNLYPTILVYLNYLGNHWHFPLKVFIWEYASIPCIRLIHFLRRQMAKPQNKFLTTQPKLTWQLVVLSDISSKKIQARFPWILY